MQVTGVEDLSKSRSKVYIDGEFAFVLYKGELRLFHIREGEELSPEDHEKILREVLPKRAKARAMNLLMKRDYTEAKLREKLLQGLYPEAVTEEALEYVASHHYTDDLRYAAQYILLHEAEKSKRRIGQDLCGRGISRETFEKAWNDWEEQSGGQNEVGMIRKLLAKRKYDPEQADYRERARQAAFLMRKGFSAESIREAMRDDSENSENY